MEQKTGKQQRPWGRIYLMGVRIFCLGILVAAVVLFFYGRAVAGIVLGVASRILEIGIYRCPYCKTRLNPKQRRLPPHCICPECHREL